MKKRMLALTLSAVMAASLFTGCGDKKDEPAASDKGGSTAAEVTGDFDWKRYEGTELNVLFSEHTYADAVEAKLKDFEDLTGIKVNFSTMPESNYYES